jgi:hypothetical protein
MFLIGTNSGFVSKDDRKNARFIKRLTPNIRRAMEFETFEEANAYASYKFTNFEPVIMQVYEVT